MRRTIIASILVLVIAGSFFFIYWWSALRVVPDAASAYGTSAKVFGDSPSGWLVMVNGSFESAAGYDTQIKGVYADGVNVSDSVSPVLPILVASGSNYSFVVVIPRSGNFTSGRDVGILVTFYTDVNGFATATLP